MQPQTRSHPPVVINANELARRQHPPLLRPTKGRWLAGVCAGLAIYWGKPVKWVRLGMVAATLLLGAGLFAYLFWWLTIPAGDPLQASVKSQPAISQRLAKRLDTTKAQGIKSSLRRRDAIVGLMLLGAAAVLIAVRLGWSWQQSWIPPVALAVAGLAVAWSQLDARADGVPSVQTGRAWTRIAGGVGLVMAGALMFFGTGTPIQEVVRTGIAVLAVLIGVGLVIAPWWLRLGRALADARAERAREAERADIAAHLHDSVLQTLALIRANASDANRVTHLARLQERELRQWLYADAIAPEASLATQLKELVAQVEDGRIGKTSGKTTQIDLVIVGDCAPDDNTATILQATREALLNAVSHGQPPISVYLEITDAALEVFIRDRGDGFDISQVPADRLGVRESIIGRLERKGGKADITSRPDWGTEVALKLDR